MIKWKSNESRTPKLAWYEIKQKDCSAGDLLAAFELLLVGISCKITQLVLNISIIFHRR